MISVKHLALLTPLLFFGLTSFTLQSSDNNGSVSGFIVTSDYYGPFTRSELKEKRNNNEDTTFDMNISYTFKASSSTTSYSSVYEGVYVYYNSTIVYKYTTSPHSLINGQTVYPEIIFEPYFFVSYKTLTINFMIMDNTTSSSIYTRSATASYHSPKTIYTSNYYDNELSISGYVFTFNSTDTTPSESYSFAGLSDVFLNENYYDLPISNFYLNYDCDFADSFTYTDCYLTFSDPYSLFPNITLTDNKRVVPLNLKINSLGKISFAYDKMYVDKNTMDMSSTYISGYAATYSFYMPLGQKDLLDGTTVTLVIKEAGVNVYTINHSITYYSGNNFFGDCSTSDYCVNGGFNP